MVLLTMTVDDDDVGQGSSWTVWRGTLSWDQQLLTMEGQLVGQGAAFALPGLPGGGAQEEEGEVGAGTSSAGWSASNWACE